MKSNVRISIIAAACAVVSPLFLAAARPAGTLDAPAVADTLMLGQMAQQAMVVGQITDAATGLPIENVSVRTDRGNLSTISGDDGRYILSGAPTGYVRIAVEVPGYVTQIKRVELFSSRFTKVDFSLVAVTGGANVADPSGDAAPGGSL